MKRFFCLILVLAMMLSLFSCAAPSEGDASDESSTKAPAQEDIKNLPSKFSFGKNTENTYRSEFLGLTVTTPDGWKLSSDEDILEINNINKAIYDEDPDAAVKGAEFLYDMYAVSESDGSTICVILEKMDSSEKLKLDLKVVIESQFESLENSCKELGYTDVELSYKKITVDGRELDGYELSANYFGMVFRTVGLSLVRGDYLVSITVAALGEDGVEELLDGFDFE